MGSRKNPIKNQKLIKQANFSHLYYVEINQLSNRKRLKLELRVLD